MLLASLSIVARLALAPADADVLVELDWHAPPACPNAAAVHDAVAAMVPAEPVRLDPLPRASARIERDEWGFRLVLELGAGGVQGRRELQARACASLVDAVALEVALLIEAERDAARAVSPAVDEPPPPSPAATPRVTTPTPHRRARPSWRVRVGAAIGGRVVTGTIAAPTLGVAIVGRHWSGALDLTHWPRGFAPLPGRVIEGARLSLTAATITGCGRWSSAPTFALAGCAGVEAGAMVARGVGLEDARDAADLSLAVVAAPAIELGVARGVALSLGPWVRIGVVRPGVRVEGVGEIDRAARWAFGGALRLELAIPGRKRRARGISWRGSAWARARGRYTASRPRTATRRSRRSCAPTPTR